MDISKVKRHLMTGVSYMIPAVVAGGILLSLGIIMGEKGFIASKLVEVGVFALKLMVPLIAGFISYSIADKPGITVGLVGGVMARELGTGYIGGILAGFFAGWITNQIKKIPVHKNLMVIKPIMIIPVLGVSATAIFMYLLSIPLAPAMRGLEEWLVSLKGANLAILGLIIGFMMAFDMGGPVNKIALTFCYATLAEGIYHPMAAAWIGIMTPPIGLALATLINSKKFTKSEKANALPAAIMGSLGITEGAIPYAVTTPLKVIPAIMLGSGIGAAIALLLGAQATIPCAIGIWGLPFLTHPFKWLIGFVSGILITAALVLILRKESDVQENDEGTDFSII
ncbi:PTS system, fructose-specific IIC component [Caloranaerobacter azorensis DSM 13643]|uniref:PTS system, fructose-specific IIC component n=1 Tax=Caloranaerobacter azorensis DSM 13643 TaxID=1121264 RepID=A0A1M5THS4_9FIRM|nr:PTS fructose transporter subunit IIC [Caloranaerobacter azorensis]SHH50264.1 PTS system, fructose-specific IIC component [Caloranaerobacter azorensis DSM 13643]